MDYIQVENYKYYFYLDLKFLLIDTYNNKLASKD